MITGSVLTLTAGLHLVVKIVEVKIFVSCFLDLNAGDMNTSRQRHAFTLIELLVVIAIIGILVGLTLPAVQMVRESARRTSCVNNLKQLITAVHNYETARRYYPPSRAADEFVTWPVFLMPYLELNSVYDRFDIKARYADQDSEIVRFGMPTMFCPSRRSPEFLSISERNGEHVGSVGDYAGNAGSTEFLNVTHDWAGFTVRVDGVFNSGLDVQNPVSMNRLVGPERGRYRQVDILDGVSNTIFLGEKAVSNLFLGEPGGAADNCIYNGDDPGTFMRVGGIGLPIQHLKNVSPADFGDHPQWGSFHSGVCNFALGDGSVQTLPTSTDEEVLRRLCSRIDGQTVTLDF